MKSKSAPRARKKATRKKAASKRVPSGTTLIACELLDRTCYAMEIDPGYVDVIIARWQDRTGQAAIRSKDGKAFDDIPEGEDQ